MVEEELTVRPTTRLQAALRLESVTVDGSTAAFPEDNLACDPDQELDNRARQRSFTPPSVSLGLLQDLPWDMTSRVTGQYVQRAPSAAELFSRGAHDASGTFDIGNPNLKLESAATAELGLARETGAFRFDASLFYSMFDGFIYKALTDNSCGESFGSCAANSDGEFRQIAYGQRNARFYGAEVRGELDLLRFDGGTAGLSGRYDFVRAEFDNDGGNLPRIPPHRLGGGVFL
jgi:iron complex outermembrane receptor protein